MMNIVLKFKNPDLQTSFLAEAKTSGFINLKGHRELGGVRISNYNAVTLQAITELKSFMEDFAQKNS